MNDLLHSAVVAIANGHSVEEAVQYLLDSEEDSREPAHKRALRKMSKTGKHAGKLLWQHWKPLQGMRDTVAHAKMIRRLRSL